jgi:signal peptidase
MRWLWNGLTNVSFMIAIIATCALLIPLLPLTAQWYQLAIVQSASMAPSLPVGSVAIYQPRDSYQVGEVIAYEVNKNGSKYLIMHRIVSNVKNQATYLTQGDATQSLEPEVVFQNQIKGKVIRVVPKIGWFLNWLQSSAGISFLIGGGLCLLVLNEWWWR